MNKIITIIILVIFKLTVFAQDKITDELKTLSDSKQFDKIIEQYASNAKEYSAKALYYIGQAYYMKEDDNNCIKFMDLSITKDSTDPAPYYIKASTLNYMRKYNDAIKCFQIAIKLKPNDAEFYSGLGDSYYQLENYDLAVESYKKATEQKNCQERPFSMIAQIYYDTKQNEKALDAFYIAKSKIDNESDLYINALFNIGLLESLKGNYDKAEPAFIELIQLDSTDYHSYAKLIQVYYHRKEYDKAKLYKDKLYKAHDKGELKDNMKDMFCFDQFKWDNFLIQVFERYENVNKGKIYNKHLFYVINNAGDIILRVQTEFSPISIELGGPKYLLCANKGDTHYNSGIGFSDDLKYDDLKSAAIKLFEKYMK
ncbi:tetratricopeptide repeat protein [Acetobacteroides hydrogenigenes]|uniref:Tetratricopeptide repeat protein n=1 Tax=Acetobacteroides hydrogenigenes TaxID=979970 RepID=A0A4R2EMB8_9BACT|nr:tetratricopeptide repeat protein [Acetobacteroides hydrogenigenes]TCN67604.1 tetratricopeptide repeat protein [Acetobacteroides hydrogenigenes]